MLSVHNLIASLVVQGYSEEQIAAIIVIGKRSSDAILTLNRFEKLPVDDPLREGIATVKFTNASGKEITSYWSIEPNTQKLNTVLAPYLDPRLDI